MGGKRRGCASGPNLQNKSPIRLGQTRLQEQAAQNDLLGEKNLRKRRNKTSKKASRPKGANLGGKPQVVGKKEHPGPLSFQKKRDKTQGKPMKGGKSEIA